ncbi:MarR family winged helix-turn-helix transcriptional regulator [Clostridium aminobutyricum]|uniref:MarR family transcriptional regulator n=1 Tax=Clostridium aminobutyricum TaxID=33953 RepID=A0A939D8T3_CLOAM|nr:MarR family transcriptional regulator [Clostridium aminobutyricum]MBN7773524.1 MarR family transcriptional regulator [Clostridium aminobutyricum]
MDILKSSKDDQLSKSDLLQLLFRVNHLLQQRFEVGLLSCGLPEQLTGPRLRVLFEISAAGKIRMNELATKLGIKARTVTQFVDALEKENFIVRIPDPSDRRATILQLTDFARPIIETADKASNSISENLMDALTLEQQNQLADILLQLNSSEN